MGNKNEEQVHDFSVDFTIEVWHEPPLGRIIDFRITKGVARYGPVRGFRTWLYRRAPWLPSWVTGWKTHRYRKPLMDFPS